MTGNTELVKFFSVPLKYASTGDFEVYMLACNNSRWKAVN
jgi:hypothetical protein